MKTLMLIADDFALTDGVSRGIVRLLEHRRLSGTGAMTNRPHWKKWAYALCDLSSSQQTGLHLNLTTGAPLTRMQTFAPSGSFPSLSTVLKKAIWNQIPTYEIRLEIDAQLTEFEESMHRPPHFIDGHQHVHGLNGIAQVLLAAIADRYSSDERPWIRNPGDKVRSIVKRRLQFRKAFAVSWLVRGLAMHCKRAGLNTNNSFAGFSSFDPARNFSIDFSSYLLAASEWHVVMCHPGEIDSELSRIDQVIETRQQELDFLLSEHASEAIERAGLELG
jgi:chitin disaccharide deacetylase